MSDKLKNTSGSPQSKDAARPAPSEAMARPRTASKATPVSETDAAPKNGSEGARLAAMDRLRHTDRLATIGRLASHIAHELGTPLNVIEAYALMTASGEVTGEAVQKNAKIIATQAGRMTKIIQDMLKSTRKYPANKASFDLLEIARTAVSLTAVSSEQLGVRLAIDPESQPTPMVGDADKLLQVAMNLLLNGVQATPEGGTVTLAVRAKHRPSPEEPEAPPEELATLEVRDQGAGITKDCLADIFKPFFTTRGTGGGIGLGLSVAQGIIKEHGGWIEVESNVGQGSCFTVYLPLGAR